MTNVNCMITNCELKDSGCTDAYGTLATNTRLGVNSNTLSLYATRANLQITAGWSETVCVKCFNGFQILTYDNLIIKQDPCSEMTVKAGFSSPTDYMYYYTDNLQFFDVSQFFESSEPTLCPI